MVRRERTIVLLEELISFLVVDKLVGERGYLSNGSRL